MKSCRELQNGYINLYKHLREYIWGFDAVEKLAELEIAIYSAFPDVSEIQRCFNALYIDMKPICEEDEDLQAAVSEFNSLIDSMDDNFYLKLERVQEVN